MWHVLTIGYVIGVAVGTFFTWLAMRKPKQSKREREAVTQNECRCRCDRTDWHTYGGNYWGCDRPFRE